MSTEPTSNTAMIFSAWAHYMATGEGSTLMLCMGYGTTDERVRTVWKQCFGTWGEHMLPGLEWASGMAFPNELLGYLPTRLLEIYADLERGLEPPGNFIYSAMVHLNFS